MGASKTPFEAAMKRYRASMQCAERAGLMTKLLERYLELTEEEK